MTSARSTPFEFTPFLAVQQPVWHENVTTALRLVLGVPDSVALTWRTDLPRGKLIDIIATVGDHFRVALQVPPSAERAYFRGQHVAFGYGGSGDDRELVEHLRKRVMAVDRLGPTVAPLADLLAAWRQWHAWQHLHDRQLREFSEGGGIIRLGFGCNQDCSFCWQARDDPDPPESVLLTWIDDLARSGARKLTFSGGEPTQYKSLLGLMQYAQDRGMASWLQTNAIALSNRSYLQRLRQVGLAGALISFHSADATSSDKVTSAPGTHARTVLGIREVLVAGLPVALNAVVERRTLAGLPDLARCIVATFRPLAPAEGQLTFGFAWPQTFRDRALWLEQMVPLDEARPLLEETLRILYSGDVMVHPVGACGFPLCAVAGVIDLFPPLALAALSEEDLLPRAYPEACSGCGQRSSCSGVRRDYLDVFGSRGITPIP